MKQTPVTIALSLYSLFLIDFLETNGLLYDSQYGFREKRSNEHALIVIVYQIQSNFDKGMLSCGVFIDLKKAFDTVDHCIYYKNYITMALGVLPMIGFIPISLIVFNQFELVQEVSTQLPTSCGVSQGSVLWPSIFLLYVNDLFKSSEKLTFYLFSDDSNLSYADKNIK